MLQEVMGRFLAPDGSPLSGSVIFTPTFLFARDREAVTLPAPVTARLDAEGRVAASLLVPSPDTEPDAWVWEACPQLRGKHGAVRLRDFAFELTAGAPVNLAEVTPVPTSTGEYVTRGKPGADGVGLAAITTEGGELVFTLTDGSETRLPAPKGVPGGDGKDGVGLATITLEDGELVFTLTDGAEQRLPAPVGEKGDDGKPGQPGKDGTSPPAPTLRVGEVTTLPATATATAEITGESPDYTLILGVPQGAPGAKGDKGDSVIGPPGPQGLPGNVTVTQASDFIRGEGSPLFRVTAPAGSLYIDTAVTNGAFMWRNFGGNFWRVVDGDTGWRNITESFRAANPTFTGGRLRVRRENNQLWVSADSLTFSSTTGVSLLGHLPPEWRIDADNATYPGAFYQMGGGGRDARVDRSDLYLMPTGGMVRDIKVYPIATRAWPTALPGMPA